MRCALTDRGLQLRTAGARGSRAERKIRVAFALPIAQSLELQSQGQLELSRGKRCRNSPKIRRSHVVIHRAEVYMIE